MAAKPPKPPGNVTSSQESSNSFKCLHRQRSDCSCTNISIMQLFHEMKQEFPTVPDHVVNQCVIDNCHDRENCIKNLKQELLSYPAQAYPAHALRNNQNFICNQPLKPTRPAPPPKINCDPKRLGNLKPVIFDESSRNNSCASDMQPHPNVSDKKTNPPPQRPTTLNFHEPRQNEFFTNTGHQRTVNKPVRTAPLPPIVKHPPPLAPQNIQNLDASFSSTSVQSPVSYSDSGESEISVNISLSPSSERSRGPSTRRISAISIQPEPPYSRDFTPQSPRSFTSLNLTLRKPSVTPQSPIDITAGPGLTYSSSSFDARRGYQNNFHITVTDQGGIFSASRIRPRSCYNTPVQHPEEEFIGAIQRRNLRTTSSEQDVLQNFNRIGEQSQNFLAPQEARVEVIQRQRKRKEQLSKALEQNRKRLDHVQHEIQVLTSPITPGESERLDNIIERLRIDCQEMLNKLEDAKRLGLPSNVEGDNAYYDQENSGQQNLPRCRPPRPPPPRVPPHLLPYNVQGGTEPTSGLPSTTDDSNYYTTNNADGGPPWTCSMCTFQNHPLLNKCECCDNIRIIPGTIQIVPSDSNSSPMFSRLPNNLTSINNNTNSRDNRNFNSTEPDYPTVMNVIPSPAPLEYGIPGNIRDV